MLSALAPIEVFCSYAETDKTWLNKLDTHLSLMRRQGLISLWHHYRIAPGTDQQQARATHLENASLILLLISPDFIASDYCYSQELKRALERHQAKQARVLPILLRAGDKQNAAFAHLQALPTDAKPIASWSNDDEALADVVAGIRRAIEDLSLLASSTPHLTLPPTWNIPYPRNTFFTGRQSILANLHQQLHSGQSIALSQPPQAISGLGGIGKTQIAIEYAYRHHHDYQAVLWAHAQTRDTLISSYVTIAELLFLPEQAAQDQAITIQAVKNWLQRERDWLLILDNADDLAMVRDFVPPAISYLVFATLVPKCYNPSNQTTLMRGAFYGK